MVGGDRRDQPVIRTTGKLGQPWEIGERILETSGQDLGSFKLRNCRDYEINRNHSVVWFHCDWVVC